MKKIIKMKKPSVRGSVALPVSVAYTYSQEYRMDPTRLKAVLLSLNTQSPCVQVIKDILDQQLEYIRKCTNAKILMEKRIVKILESDKFKNIALKRN
jgi:hypothetical protein